MDLHQPGEICAALGIAIDRSDHGLLALEDADAVAEHLQHDAVFFPFVQDFDIERFRTRIKIRPQLNLCLRRSIIN